MKRVGLVRKQFLTKDRIRDIIRYLCRAEKRHKWTKAMKKNWSLFLSEEDKNVDFIYNSLLRREYKFSPFNIFKRYENGKERIIYASNPMDQVVDTLLDHCLKYIFMEKKKIIHPNAYGSIVGKGQHELREKIIKLIKRKGEDWYVGICDTKKYYPTINHEIMKSYIRQHVKDQWVIWLVDETIERMDTVGMALGLATSNILGHVYHAAIDWYMMTQQGERYYYRFCDDKIILGKSKHRIRDAIFELKRLTIENGQTLKPTWKVVNPAKEGVEFLGAYITPKAARLKTSSRRRIERRFRLELKKEFNYESREDRERVIRSHAGIMGGLRGLDVKGLIKYWTVHPLYKEFFRRVRVAKGWKIMDKNNLDYNPVPQRVKDFVDLLKNQDSRLKAILISEGDPTTVLYPSIHIDPLNLVNTLNNGKSVINCSKEEN